jgi:hypothetical protein
MTERVIETHNIFIDTDKAQKESTSKGDDFQLHLNTQSVDADRGQFIRLTLNDFSMYKNWTDVNTNNNTIVIETQAGVDKFNLTEQNYETIHDLADNFATNLGTKLLQVAQGLGSTAVSYVVNNLKPDATTSINGTTDNIISFSIDFNAPHTLTQVEIRFVEDEGDVYNLLGGDRLFDSSAGQSITSAFALGATEIFFYCWYPAQRSTTSHIYLRTSLTTGATETASLGHEDRIETFSEVSYSNILARIPVNTEFCTFTSESGREYFLDLKQKHINNIRLYLTDQHGRRLGRRPGQENLNTASGSSSVFGVGVASSQSTLGNLSFSCVVRADIVEFQHPKEHFTPDIQRLSLARQSGLLVNPSQPPM